MKRAILAFSLLVAAGFAAPAVAQEQQEIPPRLKWSFATPFGKYDEAQLQRGFKIYREVCSTCHSMNLLAIGSLAQAGGPGFSDAQVAQIASEYKIQDLDDKGQPTERAGRPADHFPAPFPNALAAAATYGVAPPDMSTLAKARGVSRGIGWTILDFFTAYQEAGPDYIVAILRGYEDAPKGFVLPQGGHYNKYFPGHNIAMPPPLQAGQVTFDDGAPTTVEAYSQDIAAFLMWAAEPKLVQRKRVGFQVIIFLIVLSGLLYFTKKKIWHEVEKPRELAHGQDPKKTSI
jgi:cytochrome c1